MNPVTDPALLAQLTGQPQPVTDPATLAALGGQATADQQNESSSLGRMAFGAGDPIYGISQIVPRALSAITSAGGLAPNAVSKLYDENAHADDAGVSAREQKYQQARAATGQSGTDWARIGGNIISPANLVGGLGAGLMPEAATLGSRMAQGAVTGAGYAATQPVDTSQGSYGNQKMGQEMSGAAFGAAAPLAGQVIGHALYPNVSPEVKLLQGEGVRLTPGQRAGGMLRSMEDKATSIPVVGNIIQNAQDRGTMDMNTAVANRALNPIGQSLPEGLAGRDAVQHVKETLGNAYDNLLPKLQGQDDPQFSKGIQNIRDLAKAPGALPQQEQDAINGILDREVKGRISPNGNISGKSLKDMETGLKNEISTYSSANDPYQRKTLGALQEAQSQLRQMISRTNPQYAGDLQNINEGYANYARMRQAASMQGAAGGVFTPAQLAAAVKGGDKTVGKGGYATGNAYMQDLSDAAKAVLPQKSPNPSGTAGHVLLGGLLGKEGLPGIAMAIGAGVPMAAMYSSPASKLGEALASRPQALQPVANAFYKYSNPAALARALLQ